MSRIMILILDPIFATDQLLSKLCFPQKVLLPWHVCQKFLEILLENKAIR